MALSQYQYEQLLAQPNLSPGWSQALLMVPYTKEGKGLTLPAQYATQGQTIQYSGAQGWFLQKARDPGALLFSGGGIANKFWSSVLGENNRSPIGDIAGRIATGTLNVTDVMWANAGYGPGGIDPNKPLYSNVSFPALMAPTPYHPVTASTPFSPVQPINFLALFGGYQPPSAIAPPPIYTIQIF